MKTAKSQQYSYDANGNLLCVITGTKNTDGKLIRNNERKLLWDEENRLLALSDNGFVSNYWYDAAGERTVKTFGDAQGVSVNGLTSAATTGTTNFTAYISPYLVVSNGGNYTKHIYIGSQRITSKVSDSGIFGTSPVTTSALQAKYTTLTAKIKTRYDSLGVTYQGIAQTGGLESKTPSVGSSPYFYHSDHLGSSSLITDGSGAVMQHLEYVPFGDVFVDERRSATSWTTPYLFSAKERDEETGLTYFGARYYDSRTSVWLSVDPLAEEEPYSSSYVYCHNNPVTFVDPDGEQATISSSLFGWLIPPAKAHTPGQMMQQDAFHVRKNIVRYATPGEDIYGTFTGKDFDGESYNRGTSIAFALLSLIPETKLLKAGKPIMKLAEDGIKYALKDVSRLQHAFKHAHNIKSFQNLKWNNETKKLWTEFNENILKNATKSFDNVLGETKVKGFYKEVDGQNIATYVYAEGENKGKIATTVVLNENQMKKFKLKE